MLRISIFMLACTLLGFGCGGDRENVRSDAPLMIPSDITEGGDGDQAQESVDTETDMESTSDPQNGEEGVMEPRVDLAFGYLIGVFNSQVQSMRNLSYFNVQLTACQVDAPELGERVLYLEQAMASNLASPYRQRIYVVRDNGDGRVVSDVYSIYSDDEYVGLCERENLPVFTSAQVSLRQGCSVYLTQTDDGFEGGTDGKMCQSTLGGARYAVSTVKMNATQIMSWDRGYDDSDVQVWGAEEGPYEFLRQ